MAVLPLIIAAASADLAAYFVLAYGLSWLILVPAGLGLLPDSASVLAWLPPFGPAAAAFIA